MGGHPGMLTGDTSLVETAAEHNQGRRVVLLTRYTLSATDRKPRGRWANLKKTVFFFFSFIYKRRPHGPKIPCLWYGEIVTANITVDRMLTHTRPRNLPLWWKPWKLILLGDKCSYSTPICCYAWLTGLGRQGVFWTKDWKDCWLRVVRIKSMLSQNFNMVYSSLRKPSMPRKS